MDRKLLVKKVVGDNCTIAKVGESEDSNIVDVKHFLINKANDKEVKITKMFVDESGENCFLISDNIIFYNHWESATIFKIDLCDEN